MSVPGYVSYISCDANNPHRGGTCVLIKQNLNCDVIELDVTTADQLWFMIKCVQDVFFLDFAMCHRLIPHILGLPC